MSLQKSLKLKPFNSKLYKELIYRGFFTPLIASILCNREINSISQAYSFLYPDISDFVNPFCIKGIIDAVKRIEKAYKNKEKIGIYGDSDADGVIGVFILYDFLKNLFPYIEVVIPSKEKEGYGFHSKFLSYFKEKGVRLIITVDVGISSHDTVNQAKAMGLDVIITDHHEITSLPQTYVVSGKLTDKQSSVYYLCGAGVAFLLIRAIRSYFYYKGYFKNNLPNLRKYLELLNIATLADMVPIKGENRIITFFGFRDLSEPYFPATKVFVNNFSQYGEITEEMINFQIIPLINSAGRMGKPELVFKLFCAQEIEEAEKLFEELKYLNNLRKEKELILLEEINKEIIESQKDKSFIFVAKEGLPKGLLGLLANRLKNLYNKPVILIGVENGIGFGSGRAPQEYNFFKLITQCKDLIIQVGGHQNAFGFTIKNENIFHLFKRLTSLIAEKKRTLQQDNTVFFDVETKISEIFDKDTYYALCQLPPFGEYHEPPLFLVKDFEIEKIEVLKNKHSKIELKEGNLKMSAIWFNNILNQMPKTILAIPQYNFYKKQLELKIQNVY